MLRKLNEEHFYAIKKVVYDRLSPDKFWRGFNGAAVFSGIVALISWLYIAKSDVGHHPILLVVSKAIIAAFVIQLLITLFFMSERNAFKYQKLQSVALCFIMFKLSVEFFQVYFLVSEYGGGAAYMTSYGVLVMAGGLVLFIASNYRALLKVKKGEFKIDGKSLYDFKNEKSFVGTPIIYIIVLTSGFVIRAFSNTNGVISETFELFGLLLLCALIQYCIALAWPLYPLIAYCKFRFPSFIVPAPVRLSEKRRFSQKPIIKVIIKLIQYTAFFFNIVVLPLSAWQSYVEGETGMAIIIFTLSIIFLCLTLKWMSKYPVSYYGKYVINGMLTTMSFLLIAGVGTVVSGKTSFPLATGIIFIVVVLIPTAIFWWQIDIIEVLSGRNQKTINKKETKKKKKS